MVLLAMMLGWLLSGAVLFAFLRRKENRRERLLWAALIGAGAGMGRAFVACAGCLLFANTSSWLQVPAYCMVMFALPEAVLTPMNYLGPGTSLEDGGWVILARMAGTIMASSLTLAMAAALLAEISRPRAVVKS